MELHQNQANALKTLLNCPDTFESEKEFIEKILERNYYDLTVLNTIWKLINNLERKTLCWECLPSIKENFFSDHGHQRFESLSQAQKEAINWVFSNVSLDDYTNIVFKSITYAEEISSENRHLIEEFFQAHKNRIPEDFLFAFLADSK